MLPKCSAVYLHGLSSGDFVPAVEQFLGSTAACPRPRSPAHRAVAGRGDGVREAVAEGQRLRDLWVDGIHLKVRLEQDKVCLLVMSASA